MDEIVKICRQSIAEKEPDLECFGVKCDMAFKL